LIIKISNQGEELKKMKKLFKLMTQCRRLVVDPNKFNPPPKNQDASRIQSSENFAGFTLLELLMAIAMVGIILSTMLSLVVSLMGTNQRESARTETQQEMQRAMDYMTSELREAVFIYDGDCLNEDQDNKCPAINTLSDVMPDGIEPVLAFWKLKPLPEPCEHEDCEQYRLAGRTYSLVVYFLSKDNSDNKWQGKARITRYELSKFNAAGDEVNQQYVDPEGKFLTWANNVTSLNPNDDVLVDFVDDSDPDANCDELNEQLGNNSPYEYILTPANPNGGFYACVRQKTTKANKISQDAVIYLTGNASGKPGINNEGFLPTLETRVLKRGVFEKTPN
jgi:prepilin-type N-terminal cleavage/methylation domain-containing protein